MLCYGHSNQIKLRHHEVTIKRTSVFSILVRKPGEHSPCIYADSQWYEHWFGQHLQSGVCAAGVFNKGSNSNKKASLKAELSAYKEALESDINIPEQGSEFVQQKQAKLGQIAAYLKVLELVEKHPELNCLESGFPSYPRPLEGMIQDRTTSNLYSMVLRPSKQDGFLRTEGTNPVFRVAHKSVSRGIEGVESELQKALIEAYSSLSLSASDLKTEITQKAVARLNELNQSFNFDALKNMLKETIKRNWVLPLTLAKPLRAGPSPKNI
ncbi:SidC homolog [Legionella spiritensis]|nr:SidC homolog [Legionella spiritensis]